MVFTLKMWRHYLYGKRCIMYTYHKRLRYLLTQKELNLRQHHWIVFLKDCDCTIEYHPDKANVVANALSCRAMNNLRAMFPYLNLFDDGDLLAEFQVKLHWIGQIREKHLRDESLGLRFRQVESGSTSDFGQSNDGVLCFRRRVCVSSDSYLRQSILREAHNFFSGLPLAPTKKDSIWVIVDRLTKSAHFIPVRTDYFLQKLAKLYISKIVRLHRVSVSIISYRDPRFTSRFWKKLHEALGLRLDFSIVFHPQTNGQSDRVIQILKNMLQSCVIDFRDS
ncbi:uncharacterized protein LOC105789640 [Gossypium raimondii]|uniref:uncharacterized protein LOC105789640 n=1 Tax=Gossypium raimondii TaxID=29730 RepID=UPI00063AAB55|nr:uncharacterized protein LOC105789640 [Gossypium raimondii]